MKIPYLFFASLLFPALSFAQVANDDCANAIVLPQELEVCTGNAGGSNIGATPSLDQNDYSICIDNPNLIRDVWYSFVALRDAASITLRGRVPGAEVGSLLTPQFAVYENGCDDLTRNADIGCASPVEGVNGVNIILAELTIGQTYHIMVGGNLGREGTYELCVDQFDGRPTPDADCPTGVILCDKSPFSVEFLSGRGDITEDLQANGCVEDNCVPVETNSSWYKWTCDQPGTLGFTITPRGLAPNEDLDFGIYELTNGLDDCSARETLRCMYSGGNGSNSPVPDAPCFGPTGLSLADPDNSESCGCQPGNNNFARAIDMEAGKSYALVIFNFSGSGDGFDIEFVGSGTFVGPEPAFTFSSTEVCVGEALVFEDQSSSVDAIVSREWNFGPTATPQFASGPGPHSVTFGQAGSPAVNLTITTSRECREILSQREVTVVCCEGQFVDLGTLVEDVTCPGDSTGFISTSTSSTFSPETVTYTWSTGGQFQELENIPAGEYSLTVSDASGCEATFAYTVEGPPPFAFDTLITMPSCAGGVDGALEFTVLSGGARPYEYSFNGGPFSGGNTLTDLPVGNVNVRARDANDCPVEQDIFVDELQLGLVRGVDVFTEPICAGDANGSIQIQLANGQPNFRYDFGLGDGLQPSNTRSGLSAGVYNVTAVDAEGCTGEFAIELTEPSPINLLADGSGSTCFGTDDGQIIITNSGGRPGYDYTFNGQPITDTVLTGLVPGQYTVRVTDQVGCVRSVTETITEPNEIFPVLEATFDLSCFGEPTGAFQLSATGGTPGYTYATNDRVFQTDNVLDDLPAGDYTLYVMDANGCLDSLTGRLSQPNEFVVDPGPDTRIRLGFDTIVRAVSNYSPVTYAWSPEAFDCLNEPCSLVRVAPVNTTLYTVVGTNEAGCTDTAAVEVLVIQDLPTYIPNSFSPNGDGVNDGFTVFGGPAVVEIESLQVFHRWGGMVFERTGFAPNNPALGWDGKGENGQPLNPAVFVYSARVRYLNGRVEAFAGDVTLVK